MPSEIDKKTAGVLEKTMNRDGAANLLYLIGDMDTTTITNSESYQEVGPSQTNSNIEKIVNEVGLGMISDISSNIEHLVLAYQIGKQLKPEYVDTLISGALHSLHIHDDAESNAPRVVAGWKEAYRWPNIAFRDRIYFLLEELAAYFGSDIIVLKSEEKNNEF